MRLDHFGMYPERAFQALGKRMTLEGGGKGSAPPAPDYTAAAKETAAGNKEAAISAQAGNMVNQYTPQGSVEYNVRGYVDGTPQYSQVVTMSPEEQRAYNENMAMNSRLRGVADQGVNYVQSALDKPLSYAELPEITPSADLQREAEDKAYAQETRYLDPQFARGQSDLENKLSNQGITRGSEAWNRALDEFNVGKERAYAGARDTSFMKGISLADQLYRQNLGGRQQGISELNYLRTEPINILNAVRTGSQMQTSQQPQVGTSSPGQLATWSGPDILGATTALGQYNQGLYNANTASSSNMTSGLMGLAGTAAMAGATY